MGGDIYRIWKSYIPFCYGDHFSIQNIFWQENNEIKFIFMNYKKKFLQTVPEDLDNFATSSSPCLQ
jgi:hypothetical protein